MFFRSWFVQNTLPTGTRTVVSRTWAVPVWSTWKIQSHKTASFCAGRTHFDCLLLPCIYYLVDNRSCSFVRYYAWTRHQLMLPSQVTVMDACCILCGQTCSCPWLVCIFKDQVHVQFVTPQRMYIPESIQRITCLQLFGDWFYHFLLSGLLFSVTNRKRDSCWQKCLRKGSIFTDFRRFRNTPELWWTFFLFWSFKWFSMILLTHTWLLFFLFSPLVYNFFSSAM